jgi:putative chitinase
VITAVQLHASMPHANPYWLGFINQALAEWHIDASQARVALFLALVNEETHGLTALTEDLDYCASRLVDTWPGHFDDHSALAFAHNPTKLGNFLYAGKMGNGDATSGDGARFRGRVLLKGRNDYRRAGRDLGLDLLAEPGSVASDWTIGMRSAAWAFVTSGGNRRADAGDRAAA